jgi:hypothetical protein
MSPEQREGERPPARGCRPATCEEASLRAAPVESLHVMVDESKVPVEERVMRAAEGSLRYASLMGAWISRRVCEEVGADMVGMRCVDVE